MNNINHILIQQYIDGKLDAAARHELEKQALSDPFLSDALEGYQKASHSSGYHLSLLQRQLEERIAVKQENKNRFYFTWQRISIAAVGTMLFVTSGILFWMNSQKHNRAVALATHKQVEVNLSPQAAEQQPATKEAKITELAANDHSAANPARENTQNRTIVSAKQKIAAVTPQGQSAPEISLTQSSPKARVMVKNEKLGPKTLTASVAPLSGWEAYEEYLKKNLKFPVGGEEGDVTVSFNVNADGNAENLQLIKGLSEAHNQEAFRLIKEGPNWQKTEERAEVTIKFRH